MVADRRGCIRPARSASRPAARRSAPRRSGSRRSPARDRRSRARASAVPDRARPPRVAEQRQARRRAAGRRRPYETESLHRRLPISYRVPAGAAFGTLPRLIRLAINWYAPTVPYGQLPPEAQPYVQPPALAKPRFDKRPTFRPRVVFERILELDEVGVLGVLLAEEVEAALLDPAVPRVLADPVRIREGVMLLLEDLRPARSRRSRGCC